MLVWDLFAGTHSLGKVASERGHDVISVDNREATNPTICCDMLDFDYRSLPVPDFVWASTPCNTFSWLVASEKRPSRNARTPYQALTARGTIGDALLNKTLEIIAWCEEQNPAVLWVIENPKGMMRLQPQMEKLSRTTVTYCQYGDGKKKPTDLFNNFNLSLLPPCTPNHPHPGGLAHVLVQNAPLAVKYMVPRKLIESILNQACIN
jgi:site-specific DNA-cytosine methylase